MEKGKYKVVLSIDGGGIKGIIPLVILDHIIENFKAHNINLNVPDLVDLFAGSSTGSVICAALMDKSTNGAMKFSVRNVLDLYINKGPQIFKKEFADAYNRTNNPLKLVLQNNFGATYLSDLYPNFMFLSFDLNANEPYIFSKHSSDIEEVSLAEALIASTAVPGYYPPVKMRQYELADGMLACKNPAKFAYNYARVLYPKDRILLISLGTGYKKNEMDDLIEHDVLNCHNYLAKLNKADKDLYYIRLQPELKNASSDIDDTSPENIKALIDDAIYFLHNKAHFGRLFNLMKINFRIS